MSKSLADVQRERLDVISSYILDSHSDETLKLPKALSSSSSEDSDSSSCNTDTSSDDDICGGDDSDEGGGGGGEEDESVSSFPKKTNSKSKEKMRERSIISLILIHSSVNDKEFSGVNRILHEIAGS